MLHSVRLLAADGVYIASVEVPAPFAGGLPSVVIWGARVFVRNAQTTNYREAFAYMVPDPVVVPPDGWTCDDFKP